MFTNVWLPRLLFVAGLTLAAGLALLVLLAPVAVPLSENDPGPLWLQLFARDAALRRTSLASALGLAVTALVFFRGQRAEQPPAPPGGAAPRLGSSLRVVRHSVASLD